jgi:hypothetical protein
MVLSHDNRRGIVLLVVITLLTLFAVVGLTFVIYAQAEAGSARAWRESESAQRPDADPELLLAHFLGQLVYDTTNPFSALRGHSLARTMYGPAGSTTPFAGTGLFHTAAPDTYYQPDYTQYAGNAINPDSFGVPNVPYTYPDFNNLFLAAVRSSDGAVLIPSYSRTNPQQGGAPISLRPSATYHPSFPAQEDAGGDVKNLPSSPGVLVNAGNNTFANNDSAWMYTGFPVMKANDGRKYTVCFAPLVIDLDNRINLNVHGYWFCHPWLGGLSSNLFQSHMGYGPWEVNLSRIISQNNEAPYLYKGNNGVPGKYDTNFWGNGSFQLGNQYAPSGTFYSETNFDSYGSYRGDCFVLPGIGSQPGTVCFPFLSNIYGNGGIHWTEKYSQARNYNFFSPTQNCYSNAGLTCQSDRRHAVANMEALLRYGDRGSPALTSDLFRLCPTSFQNFQTRWSVTTHSFDLLQPGVSPSIWQAPNTTPLQLNAGSLAPTAAPLPFPPQPNAPTNGEFNGTWQAVTAALGRIDLNRPLPAYPAVSGNFQIDPVGFATATQARQQFAKEIFNVLWQTTGAANPANYATLPAAQQNALRYLAQLAVNIVDYIDSDDFITPFKWYADPNGNTQNDQWVYGTELPRGLINEAYCEIANDPADAGAAAAQKPYRVNFWLELHNPMNSAGQVDGTTIVSLTENGNARLQVPANGNNPSTACYQIVLAKSPNNGLRGDPTNVLGNPDMNQTMSTVTDFSQAAWPAGFAPQNGVDTTIIQPANNGGYWNATGPAPNGGNSVFYVVGPPDDFPGTDPNKPTATVRLNTMYYTLPNTTDLTQPLPQQTVLLRRLACPYMPAQADPTQPNYNPFVTVDYMDTVPVNIGVQVTSTGANQPTPVAMRASIGRNQPYAGDKSQLAAQAPNPALTNQPQHTFFNLNAPVTNPFTWLAFMDRPLVSPMELLHVSGFKPHELTQQFICPNQAGNVVTNGHQVPWADLDLAGQNQSHMLYRAFEFFEAGTRLQWCPVGARTPGKININTTWDLLTFQALCDRQSVMNYFADTDVSNIFTLLTTQRTPNGVPGPTDSPFRGMAAGFTAAGDQQYPNGSGVQNTLLAPNPNTPGQLMFEYNPGANGNHPYLRYQLLSKIFNNVTTRSNVFAVFLTAGFFEVLDDSNSNKPPVLGQEIGRAENRHIRHRMFAIIDRTNLTLNPNSTTQAGPRPFFIESLSSVANAGAATINVPALSGSYEEGSWSISQNMTLTIDSGANQETVQVTATTATPPQFTATFTKPHAIGFSIMGACGNGTTQLGNPGPQVNFDMRNPVYQGVIRYFSIIQ